MRLHFALISTAAILAVSQSAYAEIELPKMDLPPLPSLEKSKEEVKNAVKEMPTLDLPPALSDESIIPSPEAIAETVKEETKQAADTVKSSMEAKPAQQEEKKSSINKMNMDEVFGKMDLPDANIQPLKPVVKENKPKISGKTMEQLLEEELQTSTNINKPSETPSKPVVVEKKQEPVAKKAGGIEMPKIAEKVAEKEEFPALSMEESSILEPVKKNKPLEIPTELSVENKKAEQPVVEKKEVKAEVKKEEMLEPKKEKQAAKEDKKDKKQAPTAKLYKAAIEGNTKEFEDIIANFRVDLNAPSPTGDTTLMAAVYSGNVDIVNSLLEKNVNLDNQNNAGNTAMHLAAAAGREDLVNVLLDRKANPNLANFAGITPLLASSATGNLPVVQALVSKGANMEMIDKQGNTPLHVATANGQVAVAQHLVSVGANVTAKNFSGLTPRDLAISTNQLSLIPILQQPAYVYAQPPVRRPVNNAPLSSGSYDGNVVPPQVQQQQVPLMNQQPQPQMQTQQNMPMMNPQENYSNNMQMMPQQQPQPAYPAPTYNPMQVPQQGYEMNSQPAYPMPPMQQPQMTYEQYLNTPYQQAPMPYPPYAPAQQVAPMYQNPPYGGQQMQQMPPMQPAAPAMGEPLVPQSNMMNSTQSGYGNVVPLNESSVTPKNPYTQSSAENEMSDSSWNYIPKGSNADY